MLYSWVIWNIVVLKIVQHLQGSEDPVNAHRLRSEQLDNIQLELLKVELAGT